MTSTPGRCTAIASGVTPHMTRRRYACAFGSPMISKSPQELMCQGKGSAVARLDRATSGQWHGTTRQNPEDGGSRPAAARAQ